MNATWTLGALAAAALALFAAQPAAADAAWDELVKKAEAEGEVNVHGGPGRYYAQALGEAFAKTFPKIKMNFDGGPSREAQPKIMREFQSGINNWDVFVGGAPSLFQTLMPLGMFTELKPALILPEVLDDKAWRGGFDAGWMDLKKKYSFGFDLTGESTMFVNWDFVKKEDLQSVRDLMKPQFAGKIVSHDPRVPGEGVFTFQTMYINFGEQFVIDVLSKQKITYTLQRRQAAEWVVRGQYPIGLATPPEDIRSFQKQGLGKDISVFKIGIDKPTAGVGFGMVTLFAKAPHPNAAKLYVNWLLSKDGQSHWQVTARNSRRLDVPLGDPEYAPPADKKVFNLQAESEIPVRDRISALAKQLISTEAGK